MLGQAGGYGAARIDTLLARLTDTNHSPTDRLTGPEDPNGEPRETGRTNGASTGEPAAPARTDGTPDHRAAESDRHDEDDQAPAWWNRLTPPKLLLRLPVQTLLDDTVPAELLTRLAGGRLRLTSTTARKLLDTRGAQLRTLVIDDNGTVLGIGRATRQPPGWLTDTITSMHDTCTGPGPGCNRPARDTQLDHATPWWPARPDDPYGTTDLDNLGPLCPTTNRAKETAGWRTVQTAAGTRTWHHPRSGLTTTTIPSTWRPPDDPRTDRHRHRQRPPARPDQPGPPEGIGPRDPARPREPGQLPAPEPNDDDLPF